MRYFDIVKLLCHLRHGTLKDNRFSDCVTKYNAVTVLDYGYSIVLSAVAREIVCCGYSTQLGIFHDNMFNKLNLACDLVEPFRPLVDHAVRQMAPEKLEHDEKMKLVQILNRQILIDGSRQYLLNAIRIFVKSAMDAMREENLSSVRWPVYELQIYANDDLL